MAAGFNRGILFLAGVPFLTVGAITFLILQSVRENRKGIEEYSAQTSPSDDWLSPLTPDRSASGIRKAKVGAYGRTPTRST